MKTRPQTVVCLSCTAKFHVPDELVRGKLVKFRCRKCGGTIDVDGRSASPPQATQSTPPRLADVAALETPASFADRTLPPQPTRPGLGSVPQLHSWPEPPHTHTSTAPLAISEPPVAAFQENEALRDPSNRAPKIAAIVALAAAAGLSVLGFVMRTTPDQPTGLVQHSPADPAATPRAAAQTGTELSPSTDRPTRGALKVTDLPAAVDGVAPAPLARSTQTKTGAPPSDQPVQPLEDEVAKPQGAPPAAPVATAEEAPATPPPAENASPEHAPVAAAAPPPAPSNSVAVAVPAPSPAAPPPASPPPAAAPSPVSAAAPVTAPAAVNRARSDFNTSAAREALEDGAARASSCRTVDSPSGTARLAVTFAPTGHVTQAVIESGPFVGTAAGNCIANKFRALKIAPYTGESVTVHKSIPF